MLGKISTILIIGLIINMTTLFTFANENKKEKEFAEKVKTSISKIGTGTDAKIKVKLKDKRKLKGYITEIKSDSFVIFDKKTNKKVEIFYSQTKQVKANNLSNGVKIALGVGLIVGVIAILVIAGKSD